MKKIELAPEETQAIINYLVTKPYQEVFQMVNLLAERLQVEKKDN